MMKNLVLVIIVSNAIGSYPQELDELDLAQSDELSEGVEESRSAAKAFGAAAVPAGTRLLPAPGPGRNHECYVCTDCPRVLANSTFKICPYSADSLKNNKCVVYAEQYRHMTKPLYVRGCASERGTCVDIIRAHAAHGDIMKLNFCQECDGDKCNVNGGERPGATLVAFFVLVVTPLLAKHTLS